MLGQTNLFHKTVVFAFVAAQTEHIGGAVWALFHRDDLLAAQRVPHPRVHRGSVLCPCQPVPLELKGKIVFFVFKHIKTSFGFCPSFLCFGDRTHREKPKLRLMCFDHQYDHNHSGAASEDCKRGWSPSEILQNHTRFWPGALKIRSRDPSLLGSNFSF